MGAFTGKTAVVTGASSGIGAGDRAPPGGRPGARLRGRAPAGSASRATVRGRWPAAGGAAHRWCRPTCGAPGEVQGLVRPGRWRTRGRLDVMVNKRRRCPSRGPIADGDPAAWREMLEVNVLGHLAVGGRQAAVPRQCEHAGRTGHIVNISSSATLQPAPGFYGANQDSGQRDPPPRCGRNWRTTRSAWSP